ncbi:MAG: prepilin-type N-terminal cleavage/methylation domain-containing protein [Luteolibacter sp.]
MRAFGKSRGFTLVELMAAMAVSAVVLLGAAMLLSETLDHHERTSNRVSVHENARIGWNQLRADLEASVSHREAVFECPDTDWPRARLGMFRLLTDEMQQEEQRVADLGAVHYYLEDLTLQGKTVRCLMRGVRGSVDTFSALKEGETAELFVKRPVFDEPVMIGVMSFWVEPKRWLSGWVGWTRENESLPEALEVRVVAVSPRLAARLGNPADWNGEGRFLKMLGRPEDAASNPDFEVFSAIFPLGGHGK